MSAGFRVKFGVCVLGLRIKVRMVRVFAGYAL